VSALVKAVRALAAAVSFLTVLPVSGRVSLDGTDVARGSVLFPVVGAAIGAASGSVAWGLGDELPPLLAAVLAVSLGAVVTGALHLDGLADCADSFGGRTREDRLRIMRDHSIGTYGATALLIDLLVRVSALAALAGTRDALWFSVAAATLARTGGPLLSVMLPYAQGRPGAGEALNAHPSQPRAALALGIGGLITFLVLDPSTGQYATSLATAATVLVVVSWAARRRLGGVTGDVMGASSELVEIVVLTALVALV
jgi:adenosylcobinamide-GDP ribazoletransferase